MAAPPPEPKPTKPLDPVAQQIATTLGETEPVPLLHIRRIVQTLGPDRAVQLLAQAQTVEADGGLMVLAGRRRRTPGGVFCWLRGHQRTRIVFATNRFYCRRCGVLLDPEPLLEPPGPPTG